MILEREKAQTIVKNGDSSNRANLSSKQKSEEQSIIGEYKHMTDLGHLQTISKLRKEVKVLKCGILDLQDALKASVNDSLEKMQYLDNFETNHHRFDKKVKTFIKNCKVEDLLKKGQILAPMNEKTTEKFIEHFKENIKRFKKFTDTLLNP